MSDSVACAGAGFANHAELNSVPENMVAKIPDNVPEKQAAFTTVGSVTLHGVRHTNVHRGERIGIIELALIRQSTL